MSRRTDLNGLDHNAYVAEENGRWSEARELFAVAADLAEEIGVSERARWLRGHARRMPSTSLAPSGTTT